MSTGTVRAAMVPVSRKVRAYFAPVDRETEQPAIFDPGKHGAFLLDSPPAPWLSLGWIDNFQRSSGTTLQSLRAGKRGGVVSQFRGPADACVEFDFREWGKLQMALACGSQHMNVLAPDANAAAKPSGGTPLSGVAVLTGSTASEIVLGAGAVDAFSVGDLVAVDLDYQQQTGFVGAGISAAYVKDAQDVNHDANYIRRVTFNVGRVAEKSVTSILMAQPLIGGAPPAGASVQRVAAFVDREGGSFFQEWSGLFVAEEESGGRVCFHYPRLSPRTATGGTGAQQEDVVEIAQPLASLALRASFVAMPHVDTNDGETVVCYRSYFPAAQAAVY